MYNYQPYYEFADFGEAYWSNCKFPRNVFEVYVSLIIYFSGSLQSPAPPPPVQQIEQPAYDIENVISDEAGINTQENAIIRGK